RAQEVRVFVVDRRDLRFRHPRMPGPGIAHGESVAAGVEGGDLQPHELAKRRVDRALVHEGGAEGGERLHHDGIPRVDARARRSAGLALGLLTQVPDLAVDLVDAQRLDPCHRYLQSHARSMISIQFGYLLQGYSVLPACT